MTRVFVLALLGLLPGCGSLFGDPQPPTLADLEAIELPVEQHELPEVSLTQLAGIYREVLAGPQDVQTQQRVSHRLADIEMLVAEERLIGTDASHIDFSEAIESYEVMLRDNPDYAHTDRLLYQLSKAYALNGHMDESMAVLERLGATAPQSPYLPEAWFRLAERRFIEADFASAETLYSRVIDFGDETPYYTRALYMQGWSRFKQDAYTGAIAAFTISLDQVLPEDIPLDSLSRAEQELVQDSLRIVAIIFSKQQGVDSIASAYERLGVRPWEHLLYEALGELYLSQERYGDSAMAYQAYIDRRPDSRLAHHFQVKVIETYEAGGFKDLIVDAKRKYVEAFSVTGAYWQDSDPEAQLTIAGWLQVFIPQLARHYHAMAQAGQREKAQIATDFYSQAAHYYRLYLESFPAQPEASTLGFLLAESLYEAGNYLEAIDAYEQVAYQYADPVNAADAAYTAILAYDKLGNATNEIQNGFRRKRINSELRFQDTFPTDPRAPEVLGHAAGVLLELEDYPGALAAATKLVALSPAPDDSLLIPAWLVVGHSRVALDDLTGAETAYRQSLDLLPADDSRTPDTREHLAATIYRQGEQAVESGEDEVAAAQFQRAMVVAPVSDISASAQFDAAQALLRSGNLTAANSLLLDFRQRHPDSPLSAGIGATLLANYEQMEHWGEAAKELDRMRLQGELEGDDARQALIVSARYYEQAGDQSASLERYRVYAINWPAPVDENIEIVSRLIALYKHAGNNSERRHWQEKIMAIHDGAGSEQSDRSRYLAAEAAAEMADEALAIFSGVELTQPLAQALPTKKDAMEKVLAGYTRCNDYAVEQFVTRCTYRLGEVYGQFSKDLMDSERPAGLDTLALGQYEIMLEEQAFPFEEQAIALHEVNAQRCRKGVYDRWVQDSFASLALLLPARYAKREAANVDELTSVGELAGNRSRKVQAFNRDAIALRRKGDFPAAEEAYLAALRVEEGDAVTHHNIGILYDLYLGDLQKAAHHYRRLQDLTGGGGRGVAGWIADLDRRHSKMNEGVM